MTISATYIDNCSHGYLQVNKEDFRKVLATSEERKAITGYSGIGAGCVYLEEDCDAGLFLTTAKAKGIEVDINEAYRPNFNCPKNYSASKVN